MLYTIGKIIFGLYFIYNGYGHLKNLAGTAAYASSKNVPMPKVAVSVTGLLLLFGGVSILTGYFLELGLLALVVFLVPTTFMMHNFWKEADPMAKMNAKIGFTKNMALVGAILMIMSLV